MLLDKELVYDMWDHIATNLEDPTYHMKSGLCAELERMSFPADLESVYLVDRAHKSIIFWVRAMKSRSSDVDVDRTLSTFAYPAFLCQHKRAAQARIFAERAKYTPDKLPEHTHRVLTYDEHTDSFQEWYRNKNTHGMWFSVTGVSAVEDILTHARVEDLDVIDWE